MTECDGPDSARRHIRQGWAETDRSHCRCTAHESASAGPSYELRERIVDRNRGHSGFVDWLVTAHEPLANEFPVLGSTCHSIQGYAQRFKVLVRASRTNCSCAHTAREDARSGASSMKTNNHANSETACGTLLTLFPRRATAPPPPLARTPRACLGRCSAHTIPRAALYRLTPRCSYLSVRRFTEWPATTRTEP